MPNFNFCSLVWNFSSGSLLKFKTLMRITLLLNDHDTTDEHH